MAIPKITGAQRDFSAGEIDEALKRADSHPARETGLRQCANMRILNAKNIQNRPGRTALFPTAASRIEEVLIQPGVSYKLAFSAGTITIVNAAGTVVASFGGGLLWTQATTGSIVYAVLGLAVYITYPGMQPQVLSFDGTATWSLAPYAEILSGGIQKRTFFYRVSPPSVLISVSGVSGSISIIFSAPIAVPGMVGTRIRYLKRQILITGYTNPTTLTGAVQEVLPPGVGVTFTTNIQNQFGIGDVLIGATSGAEVLVIAIGTTTITGQVLASATGAATFIVPELVVGPAGSATTSGLVLTIPQAISLWDDEVMNPLRGYPASVFTDQFRLGFCNFPAVPGGIGWSAINNPTDLYVGAQPSSAIFEVTPDKTQVFYVLPGPESSEFVFTDKRIYYIPITATNPLVPGSVAFNLLSSDGSARVQPRVVQEVILYAGSGARSMRAVIATGAYLRPFNTRNISEFATHLFAAGITEIAAQTSDATFAERYIYVQNADGSVVVGKHGLGTIEKGEIVGWVPWTGKGAVGWISALGANVLFVTSYFGTTICEAVDDTQYLDAAFPVNAAPASFAPPGAMGPLWWVGGQTVSLMDQVTRSMGTYQVDPNGFIIPQNNGGENLAALTLIAGQPWTAIAEPFVKDADPGGPSVGQRMFKRRVARFAAYVSNSSGFVMARLFSGPLTRTSPALGTLMNSRRIPTWNQDDDPTKPPPLREEAQRSRPIGRSFDPRVAIIKDTPGPLLIHELGTQATI